MRFIRCPTSALYWQMWDSTAINLSTESPCGAGASPAVVDFDFVRRFCVARTFLSAHSRH